MVQVFLENSLKLLRQLFSMPAMKKHVFARAREGAGGRKSYQMAFHQWYAWYPVWPQDEQRIFWLEIVWVRYDSRKRIWGCRSFRTESEKLKELVQQQPLP